MPLAAPSIDGVNGPLIDLGQLTGAPVVRVLPYVGKTPGDIIYLLWEGLTQGGVSVVYTADYTVKNGEENTPATFIVPRSYLDSIADGSLTISYRVQSIKTGLTRPSENQAYTVQGAVSELLPAPTVAGVTQGGELNPTLITDGVLVTVRYDSMVATDAIRVAWFGEPPFIVEVPGNASKTVQVTMPNSVVAASLNQPVAVRYGVTHAGSTESASEAISFRVGALAEAQLPKPVVPEAQNGVLDLSTFAGDATVTVAKWPLIAVGQTVWLTVIGPNGVPTLKLLEEYPITEAEVANGIRREIPRADLEQVVSMLAVTCKVGFDGGASEQNAKTFPIAIYTVNDSAGPSITSVTDSKGQVANGGTTFDTSITLAGKASPSQQVQILDGTTSKGDVSVNANGDWTTVLAGLSVASHSITVKGLYGSNPVSAARTFTVQMATTPLTIDTSTLTLNGVIVRYGREPTTPPGGSFATRTATGGTPPYTYTVANSNIVNINAATGRVVSFHSGQTIVTARDSGGQTVSYPVVASNVRHIDGWSGFNIYRESTSNAANVGGVIPSVAEWNAFRATYGGTPNMSDTGPNQPAWSRDSAGGIYIYCVVPNSGATSTQPNRGFIAGGVGGANGWAIINR
jgi:hypothetical protein